MPFVLREGIRLYYESHGKQGDPVVLVHGSWVDHRSWSAVVGPLSQNLQVLTYDRRGHGESTGPIRGEPVHEDARDLASLLEEIDFFPVHLVAHSYAGAVALRLAHDRPEMVRSLALHEPPFVGLLSDDPVSAVEAERVLEDLRALRGRVAAGDREGAARGVVDAFSLRAGAWERLPPEVRAMFLRHAERWSEELGDPEAVRPDPRSLTDLLVPVLLTSGELSPPFARRINYVLASRLRNVVVEELPDVGHVPHVTAPSQYVGLLVTFLLERNVPVT